MKLRQTISLILACMMAALQPSSIVYASDIENNITQESVEDVGSNTENVEDINESTEAVNENESVEISDDIQSNDIESSMEENTANQQNNGTVEDKITDDIFSDGSTGNNLSASEDYLSDLTVRDNENKEDNTNNEVKKILSADVILPNDQTDKVTVSLKNDFNEGDKLVVNYLEGEELDKCINGINDKKNANQDSKNNSNIEIDSILPLHMVITDANGSEIQGVENYEIKISEANTNSAEFFKNLKLFHQKQTGEWEEISWNTDNDVETGLTFIDWTTQNLGNFVFVKEKVQPVKDEEADVTVEDAKSVAISDKSGIEQEKADEKSDAKCTCDTNTDNAYKHAWNCPVFLEQLKKDCTCDSENKKVTSHNFECEAFKKAITEICTCETKDAPGMHDNCKVIKRMHDELCDCGRKYDSVDDIIDNHEKDSNIVTYLMKWADYANQPEIIATTYTIKYNLNGGSISGQKTKYTSTTATFTLPTPRRTGYTFTGWTGTGLSSATKTVTVAKGSTCNRSYTANWSANKYTVSYNGNGGSGSMSQDTATYGESYTAKANSFSRPGYTFAGWNESADGKSSDWTSWIGKPWAWTYTRSITLYAQWTKNTYSISYNLNGGNVSGQKTSYDVTTEAFTLPTPTRNGYTFTGWTGTGLSSATKTVTVAKGSTGNRSYTANWSANVLTINYHNDGATGFKWSDDSKYDDITGKDIILTEKYSYDSEYGPVYGLPNTSRLYKIGYHYDGYWYLDKKNSSVKVSDQLKLPKTQDVANAFGKLTDFEKGNTTIDVYASLIPNVLTVNYYPNGATKIDKSNDEDGSDIIDIDSNVVYKTEEFKYDTEMRNYGLDDSRRFIRAGYHSENTYTVDSYDSKVSLNAGSGIYANTQDMAKTAGKLTDLENGNVTINIYAYWIPNTYVIKYNGNGSTSGSMTDSSCTYDTAFSLSKNTFSRKGYLFCGWNTQSDGKGTPYKDNESIKNLSSENEKTIILYAQWTPIKYTVKYDANGGTGEVPADTTHTFNEKGTIYPENALAKNAFTRKGYKFSGWNASRVKDGKIEWYYDNWNWYEEGKNPKSASKYVWTDGGDTHNASDVNGDILTMHAQWKANTLTINYHNDNGATWRQYPDDSTIDVSNKDIVQSETVTYDEKYKHYEFGLIDAGRLTKAGYHLNNGWKINSMDSKTIVPDTNGSMNSYENSGKGVADFLGVLTGFKKGDVTVDLYPDIAINTGTVHYYPNSNEAVAKAGYDQYITNGEFAGSLATTTSFDYKTTGGSGANTLTDVYTLFERKGYHQSAAQNWHYGSPDSDVYFHCDEEDLSPYVKDATDVHLKLYANWISNDYAVKFDGNGSTSGNMTDVTCKYDESFNLTENKFVRNNYEFIGWNTKKDGSGQDYKDKESVKNLTDEDNGTVTLYAQWKLKEYTLTVSHTISGNMGNRDKDFSFTMSLSNSNKDAVIPENIEAVFMDDIGNKSKKLFTVVDEKVTFTLSHKESIIFKDIPYETLYTISEDNENEYDVTNESASGTITKNIEVSFVSTKNGTVPTSSDTLNLYPIIMIAFAGIIYVILSQRKKIKQKR